MNRFCFYFNLKYPFCKLILKKNHKIIPLYRKIWLMQQKILSGKELGAGRFLTLVELEFQDDRGRIRHWESVDRRGGTGAAFIIARSVPDDELLLVRQFRPPAGRRMVEFPAGLIDPGESASETAVRELYEETGYRGRVLRVFPPACSSPGLTGEAISMVLMEVDGDACRGETVVPHPEDSESIECFRVSCRDLPEFLSRQEGEGVGVDSKIYTFVQGMRMAQESGGPHRG